MRQYLLLTCLIITCLSSYAQSGYIGVGQAAPKAKLDVNGNLIIGTGYSGSGAITAPADGALIEGQVGIGTSSPDISAILDLTSANKGMLAPRVQLTGISDNITIPTPATGLLIWHNDAPVVGTLQGAGFYYNSGTTGSPNWVKLSTYAGATMGDITSPNPAITITGGTNAVQGAGVSINIANNSAASAGLVSASGANPNQVWGTDGSGNPAWTSNDDADANPTNEIQTLTWTGGTSTLDISGGNSVVITGVAPSGTAGGDLTGSFPNPTITTNAVDGTNIQIGGETNGQILQYNGTDWVAVDAGSTLTAGTGISITGNTITNTGDLSNTNELQTLSQVGNTITLSNGGGSVTTTDAQDLSLLGNTLSLTNDATTVDLTPYLDNTDNQTLTYTGGTSTLAISGGNSVVITGVAPSGTAGGDLTGSYPNPTVADNAVDGTDIQIGGETNGQILQYNGTDWVAVSTTAATTNTLVNNGTNTLTSTVSGVVATAPAVNSVSNAISSNTLTTTVNGVVGTGVNLSSYLDNTDNQDLSLTGNTLSLTNDATTVNLAPYLDNTDNQTLTWIGGTSTLAITGGNSVVITGVAPSGTASGDLTGTYPSPIVADNAVDGTDIQIGGETNGQILQYNGTDWVAVSTTAATTNTLVNNGTNTLTSTVNGVVATAPAVNNVSNAISSNTLTTTVNGIVGTGVNLSSYLDNTDNQDLSLTGNTLSLTNDATSVNLAPYLDNTDNQTLTWTGGTSTLAITGGNSVVITGVAPSGTASGDLTGTYPSPTVADNAVDGTDIQIGGETNGQILQYNGTDWVAVGAGSTLTAGTGISITGNTIANTGDLSNTNELQTLSQVGNTITLSNGGGSVTTTDAQTLTYTGGTSTLAISGGNSVVITGVAPSGAAGGDLTGTYPNPTVGDNAVDGTDIQIGGETNGQILQYNGTDWVAVSTSAATTNTLVNNGTNTLTSTVNGVVATAPAVNSVSNAISSNTLTTTVNGVVGTGVNLSSYLDNTDNQDLSLSGNTLSLTNDATTVDLTPYLDNTDNQALSISGNVISLTNGGSVTLPVGTTYTADNGLTMTGSNVQLGGALIQPTTITQASNALTINNDGTANTTINLSNTGDFDVQDNGTSALYVRDDGKVGIGTIVPTAKLHIATAGSTSATAGLQVKNTVGYDNFYVRDDGKIGVGLTNVDAYYNAAKMVLSAQYGGESDLVIRTADSIAFGSYPWLVLQTSRGTRSNPTILPGPSSAGAFVVQGYDGSNFVPSASIFFTIEAATGLNDMPGAIQFHTSPDGTTSNLERMRINNAGNVGIGTSIPTAKLEVAGQVKITGGAPGAGKVLTSDAVGLATWQTIAASIGTDTDANDGLTVSYPDIDINVNNGLSLNSDNVQLGGTLIQNTTVTQGAFGMIYDLTGAGNFEVRKSSATDVFISGTTGSVGIGTATPTAGYLMSMVTNATNSKAIDINLTGGSGRGINMVATTANYDGFLMTNSSASLSASFFGIGSVLSSTNIVSGYSGYRNGSGLSYGLYGINGTNAAYATNANTWAAFLQGRTVISSESSPSSTLGTDLEVRNTTSGGGNPATVSMRQTTSNTTSGTVLTNMNFGDNNITGAQAQMQVIREATSSGAGDLPTAIAFSTTPDASATMSERMRITNAGNVGIGTTIPGGKLHVLSTSNINTIHESNSNIGTWLSLGNTDPNGKWFNVISTATSNGEGAGKLLITKGVGPATTSGTLMIMDWASGNIGINTNTPDAKLNVAGAAWISRDDVGECCGVGATLALAEATTTTGKVAGMSFHNGGQSEGNLSLQQNVINGISSRRLQMYDNQGQGMGLELSGRLWYGNGSVRTETRDDAGLQGNAGAQSGFFETSNPTANWYPGASNWQHLIDARHSNNGNNYALQIAGSFFDQRLYFRKTNGSANTAWSEVATTNMAPPVGAIIAWTNHLAGTPALPNGWVLCSGGSVADPASPINGQAIPDLNNTAGSTYGTSGGGRYLRGSTSSGATQADQLPNFEINQSSTNQGTGSGTVANNGATNVYSGWLNNYYLCDSFRWRYTGQEVRPVSFTVMWIMRIK